MKEIKIIQELCRKAQNTPDKGFSIKRNGEEVYRGIYRAGTGVFSLDHYGTRILDFNTEIDYVEYLGGYSNSDRDAVNNCLDFFGGTDRVRRYRNTIVFC